MDMLSKPVYYTGKLSGYMNVMCGKIKGGFVAVGHKVKTSVGGSGTPTVRKPRMSLHGTFFKRSAKPKRGNIRINYLTHNPAAASDPSTKEFYSNLGRDLVESIKKDGDNDNLTIVDVSRYEQSAPEEQV